jgi:hypothetical protein
MYDLSDLRLEVVDNDYAHDFISKYHYSKKCTHIVVAIGEWIGDDLMNCIVFNFPSGREMANEVWGGSNQNTLELSRMVSLEPHPRNLETYSISRAFKWLKENMPQYKVVISYADNEMGHHGYCYQASSMVYYGQSRETIHWFVDGKREHERTLFARYGSVSIESLKRKLGDRLTYEKSSETKSRYYIILAQSKTERKKIEKMIKVKAMPYPKGDNKRYDINKKGSFACQDEEEASEDNNVEIWQQLKLL